MYSLKEKKSLSSNIPKGVLPWTVSDRKILCFSFTYVKPLRVSPERHSKEPFKVLVWTVFEDGMHLFMALNVNIFVTHAVWIVVCDDLHPCEGLGRYATFKNFGMAFLLLFRVSTGDNWNGIMKVLFIMSVYCIFSYVCMSVYFCISSEL